jgi:hypothetical protein
LYRGVGRAAGAAYKRQTRFAGLCHIFAVAGNLRFPLSQPQKRHIQPERYAKLVEKLEKFYKRDLTKNNQPV